MITKAQLVSDLAKQASLPEDVVVKVYENLLYRLRLESEISGTISLPELGQFKAASETVPTSDDAARQLGKFGAASESPSSTSNEVVEKLIRQFSGGLFKSIR